MIRNATQILDALPANIALLDASGQIVAVNAAWHAFTRENGFPFGADGLATNYLDACDGVVGPEQDNARMAAAGIRSVMAGTAASYAQEYPCHSPSTSRWFQMVVAPLEDEREDGRPGGVVVMHLDISSQRLAERESTELQRRFADLLMNMELASVMLDTDGRITFCNDHLLRLTGWTRDETVGNVWFDQFIPANESSQVESDFKQLLEIDGGGDGQLEAYENRILTRAGETRLIRWSNTLQHSSSGRVIGIASIGEDITEQRIARIRLKHLNRVQRMLSGINTLIVRVSEQDALHQGACRIAVEDGGFLMSMLVLVDASSGDMRVVASAGEDDGLVAEVNRTLADPALAAGSLTGTAIRERRVMVSNDCSVDDRLTHGAAFSKRGVSSLAVFPLIVADEGVGAFVLYSGEIGFFVGDELALLTELTDNIAFAIDHVKKSDQLAYLALYDPLTGLPNAQLFQDQLDRYIAAARRDGGQVCVMVLDLDGFTDVNRTLGRQVGDELLRAVAARLQHTLPEPFALSRSAADTFAVAWPSNESTNIDLRDATLGTLRAAFHLQGQAVEISGQSGIASFPEDGEDARTVVLNAESALKLAKSSKQSYLYSSPVLNDLAAARRALEEEFRDALVGNQLRVHYQPRVDMIRGEIVGAEALIRWQHPSRGLLPPGEFIELAEETGMIVPMGAWILHAVCKQQAAWVAAGLKVVPVAANVSALQFERGDLLQVIRDALLASGLEARLLHLELTETAVMREPEAAAAALHAVRAMGVELALDDFGTGYSSLASLKRYPFSMVKIDRSFITEITSNAEDATIATAIIAMAHGLGLRVIAEGVETQGQFNYLRGKNCDEMQGYLFSRPVAADAFEQQLRLGTRLPLPEVSADTRPTLLLVDDEPSILSALTRSLRQDGYRILSAGSGEEALDLLALNPVQVIISDQRMPAMSGTEFLGTVACLYPSTVRILLSGYTDLKVVTDGVNQGAVFQFITKPWDDVTLRHKVRDAFRRQRLDPGE